MAEAADLERQAPQEDTEPERRGFFRQHPRAKWGLLVFVLILLAGGALAWLHYSVRESTDDAQIDGHISNISARVGGTVTAISVDDNQYVEAGTVLVQIDPKDYQVALQRARADLSASEAAAQAARVNVPITTTSTSSSLNAARAGVDSAQAMINAAQRGVEAARAQLAAAQARLAEAQANHSKAARDLERAKQLIAKDEISQQQYDAAVANEKALQAGVASGEAAVAQAQQNIHVADAQVIQAQARLAEAQANLRSAGSAPQQVAATRSQYGSSLAKAEVNRAAVAQTELNLQYTTVKAPVSGIVSKRSVELGNVVSPGQPLLAIVPLADIWVTANFKETQLKAIRVGQSASIHVDALDRDFRGHVDSIAGATGARFSLLPPENATGNYVKVVQRVPVKIVFEPGQDPRHLLRPGMSVEPTVFTR